MGVTREPNVKLAAVMREAGVSNKGLAKRVRDAGATRGLAITPDHGSVRGWLSGIRPRDTTIACIALVFSRELGRAVSAEDIGYPDTNSVDVASDDAERGLDYHDDVESSVTDIDSLASAEQASPGGLRLAWEPNAASGAVTGYLFARPQWGDEPQPSAAALGIPSGLLHTAIATRVRTTVRALTDLDFRFGGGHVRQLLLSYWTAEIAPELRRNHPAEVRREIFGAAADAAEALGWSAYDDGRHAAAQRYFIHGLRLAQEAGDRLMAGQILSNLSHQANYLGRFHTALQLARAAQSATAGACTPAVSAMFLAMEARALASLGDRKGCISTLGRAEAFYETEARGLRTRVDRLLR